MSSDGGFWAGSRSVGTVGVLLVLVLAAVLGVPSVAGATPDHPAAIRFLLLGDSVALTLGSGLSVNAAARFGVTVDDAAVLGCDLDPTLSINTSGAVGPATPGCPHWQTLWPTLVASAHPQVVGLGLGRWEVSDHLYDGRWVHVGDPAWDRHLVAELDQAVHIFTANGAKVVLFTMPYVDPSTVAANGQPFSENAPARANVFNDLVRQVAHHNQKAVTVIDLNRLLDPHGRYAAVVDGVTVRWSDGIHISVPGGEWLQPAILPVVARLGRTVSLHKPPT